MKEQKFGKKMSNITEMMEKRANKPKFLAEKELEVCAEVILKIMDDF